MKEKIQIFIPLRGENGDLVIHWKGTRAEIAATLKYKREDWPNSDFFTDRLVRVIEGNQAYNARLSEFI